MDWGGVIDNGLSYGGGSETLRECGVKEQLERNRREKERKRKG
jgi:hypothetical protein